jgi:hypothetical protein
MEVAGAFGFCGGDEGVEVHEFPLVIENLPLVIGCATDATGRMGPQARSRDKE